MRAEKERSPRKKNTKKKKKKKKKEVGGLLGAVFEGS